MKHIFAISALLMAAASANAQSVVINLANGQQQSYTASEITSIEFLPESETPSASIAGTYDARINVSLPQLNMTDLVDEATILTVSDGTDGKYSFTFPTVTYTMNGNEMVIPGITVADVAMMETEDKLSFNTPFEGIDSQQKSYKGTLEGTFDPATSAFAITETMQYGAMPFNLVMKYTSIGK